MTTNIVIPDYAAVFIEAFERLTSEELEETELYIQNVYATLFSFQNNSRVNLNMLRTALINTRKLNKALQDMLHNMDKFFERLLDQESYGELLREHLDGYVEEIVKKKYHILKDLRQIFISTRWTSKNVSGICGKMKNGLKASGRKQKQQEIRKRMC